MLRRLFLSVAFVASIGALLGSNQGNSKTTVPDIQIPEAARARILEELEKGAVFTGMTFAFPKKPRHGGCQMGFLREEEREWKIRE